MVTFYVAVKQSSSLTVQTIGVDAINAGPTHNLYRTGAAGRVKRFFIAGSYYTLNGETSSVIVLEV